jgi:hypothetical protein
VGGACVRAQGRCDVGACVVRGAWVWGVHVARGACQHGAWCVVEGDNGGKHPRMWWRVEVSVSTHDLGRQYRRAASKSKHKGLKRSAGLRASNRAGTVNPLGMFSRAYTACNDSLSSKWKQCVLTMPVGGGDGVVRVVK